MRPHPWIILGPCAVLLGVVILAGLSAPDWCHGKPSTYPFEWSCHSTELACYKSLAADRYAMRYPHGTEGPGKDSSADSAAIYCIKKTWK